MPFAETARCDPFSVYGQSKLAAEGYVGFYARARPPGHHPASRQRLRPRQDPATEAGVVAIFSEAGSDGRRPTVFGTGEQTRDYIHVADVVAALLAAQAADQPGPLNVGTGIETSVLELVELVGMALGRDDFEPEFRAAREGEVERSALDTVLLPSCSAGGLSARSRPVFGRPWGRGPTL